MTSMLKHGGRTAVLALTLIALACESATEPTTSPLLGVQESSAGLLSSTTGTLGANLGAANRAVAKLGDDVLRQKVGREGGTLTLLGHTLTVPAGAVDRPTMFVMAVLAGSEIEVELIAYDPDLHSDVGGKGFAVPVRLALSYGEAADDVDPSTLTIVHVKENGEKVVIPSTVDAENQVVRAELSHFSRYMLCTN